MAKTGLGRLPCMIRFWEGIDTERIDDLRMPGCKEEGITMFRYDLMTICQLPLLHDEHSFSGEIAPKNFSFCSWLT